MSTTLDVTEVRLRVLDILGRHASTTDWRDVDNLAEKVRILSDFCMDARTIKPLERRTVKAPSKSSKG